MSKALRTVGTIVAGVALVATGVGALGLVGAGWGGLSLAGISVQTLGYVGAGLSFVGSATAKPLSVGGVAGTQVDFAADPNAPMPCAFGRTGTGGRIVYATTGETKNRNILYCTVLSGAGPIQGFEGFTANAEGVTISPLTEAASGGAYDLRLWQRRQLGALPSAAFQPPNTTDAAVLGEWTEAHKLSGLAASWYVLGYDQKTYPSGVPEAVWTIKGVLAYDPRLDDTYPGGAGPHRIGDRATWSWTENPAINALTWCLGYYANGVRVMGIGAPASALDLPAFVEAANVADVNGWKVGGVAYSNDSKWDVLKALCQAGGGRPARLGATITMLVNAPRVSLATLTANDLAGGYSVQGASSVRARPNQIIPRYRSEAHGWDMVAAGPVKVAAYVTADGRLRSREVVYPMVQDAEQVAQLAAYDLVNAREFGPVSVVCKPHWMGYKPGDCITVTVADLGLDGQKMLILARNVDPMTGEVGLTLQSETDGKHDFALGRVAEPPPVPGLTGSDPFPPAPTVGSWVATGGALVGPDGGQTPAIFVTGQSDDPNATHLIIEYREEPAVGAPGPWVGNEYGISTGRYEIGVRSSARYRVQVRYRTIRGLEDAEVSLDLGLVTAGALSAGMLGDKTAAEWEAALAGATAQIEGAVIVGREAQLMALQAAAQAAGRDFDLEKRVAGQSGRPPGATIDTTIRQVAEAEQSIAEHYEEMLTNAENAAGALAIEAFNRSSADQSIQLYQVALAGLVDGNHAEATLALATLTTNTSATSTALLALSASAAGNFSSISSSLTALSTTQGSQATALFALQTTVGGHTASITSTMATVVDLNGHVAASYGVNIDADGVAVGFKGISNGITGGWQFYGPTFGIRTDAGGVKYPFFVSGDTVYLANTVIDGSLMVTGTIDAPSLTDNAASVTAIASGGSTLSGSGTMQTVLSATVYMKKAGTLGADATIAQHFPSGDRTWRFELWIDGEMPFAAYGADALDAIPLSGAKDCDAGYRTVDVKWNAPAAVNIDYRILKLLGRW